MEKDKIKYDLSFFLIVLLFLFNYLKPEFIIPGLKAIGPIRQIPNLLSCTLILIWLFGKRKVFHNKQTKLYIGFFIVLVLGGLFARNTGRALHLLKPFTLTVFVFLATISVVDSFGRLKQLLNIFLISNIFIAVLGIKGGGMVRDIPSLCDENDFSLLMNMLIPFSFFFGMETEELRKKYFWYAITGLFITGTVVSFSRGGFVGLISVFIYCFQKLRRKFFVFPLLIFLGISGYLFAPKGYWDEISTLKQGTQESTASTRIYLWTNAFKIFLHHPIIGVGPHNAGVWFVEYDSSEQAATDWGRALHSIYFTLLSETGIVGTILYFLIIYYGEKDKKYIRQLYESRSISKGSSVLDANKNSVSKEIRQRYFLTFALTGALIGYSASGIFLSVLFYPWFWTLMTYTVILRNISHNIFDENANEPASI